MIGSGAVSQSFNLLLHFFVNQIHYYYLFKVIFHVIFLALLFFLFTICIIFHYLSFPAPPYIWWFSPNLLCVSIISQRVPQRFSWFLDLYRTVANQLAPTWRLCLPPPHWPLFFNFVWSKKKVWCLTYEFFAKFG